MATETWIQYIEKVQHMIERQDHTNAIKYVHEDIVCMGNASVAGPVFRLLQVCMQLKRQWTAAFELVTDIGEHIQLLTCPLGWLLHVLRTSQRWSLLGLSSHWNALAGRLSGPGALLFFDSPWHSVLRL